MVVVVARTQLESRLAEAATQLLSVHAAAQTEATELRRRADDAAKQRAAVDAELQARELMGQWHHQIVYRSNRCLIFNSHNICFGSRV